MQISGETISWYGFGFVKLRVIMPRIFEGGLQYEVQNDERNLRESMLNRSVVDNKDIYIHLTDSLKIFYSLLQLY